MRVLGIDPGFDRLGMAVVEGDPSRPVHVWSDCVTPDDGPPEKRLAAVGQAVCKALKDYEPDFVAIETLFFSTNKKTALSVAEARGVILSVSGAQGFSVREFSPGTVKLAVTGHGSADKAAIERMIPHLIALPEKKRLDDELDAIAVAIAGLSSGLQGI